MKLLLPKTLRLRIEHEARASFPRECCGLIEGVREGGTARALSLHSGRNIAPAADCFEIAPEDHLAALKKARANGRGLIGCYHSHPGGKPEPSACDLQGAGEEDFLWLIASLTQYTPVRLAVFVYSGAVFLPVEATDEEGAVLVTSSGKARN